MTVLTSVPEPVGGRPVAPAQGGLWPLGPVEVRITGGSWSGGTANGGAIVLCDRVG